MAKVFISNELQLRIGELIQKGNDRRTISKDVGISQKIIIRIARDLGFSKILHENSIGFKSRSISEIAKKKYHEKLEIYIDRHSNEIIELLDSGADFKTIRSKIGYSISYRSLNDVIKILGRHEQRLENSKCSVRKNALKGSASAVLKIKGRPMKPITDELVRYYQECIYKGVYEGDAIRYIRKTYGRGHTGANTWNKLIEWFGKLPIRPKVHCGEKNGMYGKEPSLKAGNGIKGWIYAFGQKVFFRSSLELFVYCYLIKNSIQFALCKHVISYNLEGKTRNYFPDIVIDSNIYEIKPTSKLDWELNIIKHRALKKYCIQSNLGFDYITEKTYNLDFIDKYYIDCLIEKEVIIMMNEKQYNRLQKYLKK